MLTVQVNPYNALVIRGILGAIAALVYVVLGAADVALTEALVGTMLAITLYAVAVRSSLVMQIGVLKDELSQTNDTHPFAQLIAQVRTIASKISSAAGTAPVSRSAVLTSSIDGKRSSCYLYYAIATGHSRFRRAEVRTATLSHGNPYPPPLQHPANRTDILSLIHI